MRVGDFNGDAHDDILWRKNSGELVGWLGGVGLVSDRWTYIHFSDNPGVAGISVDSSWRVVTSGDFNGDGRDDLIWRHTSGEITQWLGRADGSFFNNGAIAGKVVDNSWHVIGAGDFNGDGRDDVLWRHENGEITEWLGQGNGGFVNNHDIMNVKIDRSWKIVDIGDYNGDGKSDLLWRHSSGEITQWLGQADGSFFNNYDIAYKMIPLNWQVQSPSTYLF